MLYPSFSLVLLATAGLSEARSVHRRHLDRHLARRAAATSDPSTSLTLSPDLVQVGSENNGIDEIGSEAGEAPSSTSTNNFINFCAGQTLTNGLQLINGSCNGIPMGQIPAKTNMVSSMITFPLSGTESNIQADTTFNITVQMSGIEAGFFTNADNTYYAAPQQINSAGVIRGHTHVTVQDMGDSLNPTTPLDPTKFSFFKGINSPPNGEGVLTATVLQGLPAGNYRICTLASAENHQPVLMPVAQRGSADDCTKVVVGGTGTTINVAANDGSSGLAAAAEAASAVANFGHEELSSTASAGSSTSVAVDVAATSSAATSTTTSSSTSGDSSSSSSSGSSSSSSGGSSSSSSGGSSSSSSGNGSSSSAKSGKSGKSGKTTTSTQTTKITVVEVVTFFEFEGSTGGVCPAVGKSDDGESFIVLEETFTDIKSAAAAACEAQFTTCQGFAGPLFDVEECTTQKESCGGAASSQTSAAAPTTVTASVTVAATQSLSSVSGVSAIATITSSTTVVSTVAATATAAPTSAAAVDAVAAPSSASTESQCSLVTSTVYVDAPTSTPVAAAAPVASSVTGSVSASGTAAAAQSTATVVSTSTNAIGGIEAPPVLNSGNSERAFEVNGDTFVNESAAVQRACSIQNNACADAVNAGTVTGFTVADCNTQEDTCNASD